MMMVLRTPWISDVALEIFSVVLFVCKVKERKQSIKSQTPKPKILKTINLSRNDCFDSKELFLSFTLFGFVGVELWTFTHCCFRNLFLCQNSSFLNLDRLPGYATLSQILVWFWPNLLTWITVFNILYDSEIFFLYTNMILKSIHKRILHFLNSWVCVTILSVIQVTNSCWVGSCHFSKSASNANLLPWFKKLCVGIRLSLSLILWSIR